MAAASRLYVRTRPASEAPWTRLGVGLLVAMGCTAIAAYGVGRHRHDQELGALRATLRDLQSSQESRDDADAVGRRIEALEGAYRACLLSRASDVPAPAPSASATAVPPANRGPVAVPEMASPLDLAERTFDGESVDATWGQGHTEVLKKKALANLGADSRLVKIECRTSLCRMDLTHPSLAASNAFIEKMFIGPDALEKAPFMAEAPAVTSEGTRSVALLVGRADGPSVAE